MKTSKLYTVVLILFSIALIPKRIAGFIGMSVSYLISYSDTSNGDYFMLYIPNFIIELIVVILLIVYSKKIIGLLGLGNQAEDEEINIDMGAPKLIKVFVICLGLYISITSFANAIDNGLIYTENMRSMIKYNAFKTPYLLISDLTQIVLGIILVYMSNFFTSKVTQAAN